MGPGGGLGFGQRGPSSAPSRSPPAGWEVLPRSGCQCSDAPAAAAKAA